MIVRSSLVFWVIAFGLLCLPTSAAQARPAISPPPRVITYASALVTQLVHPDIGSKSRDIYPDKMPATRGMLFVPENRDNPASRSIVIGFWVIKSTAAHPAAPIVYLSGGPGHSWVEQEAQTYGYFQTIRKMARVADVILFDQRGAGAPSISLPSLQCPEQFSFPLNVAWQSRTEVIAQYSSKVRDCARYFTDSGADLKGYNNRSSATDLDDLRKALGYPRLNIWGESYGGYLAQTFLSLYPQSVERAVIGETAAAELNPRERNHARPTFDKLISGFTSESGVVFPPDPGLLRDTTDALNRLQARPMRVDVTDPVDGKPLQITLGRYDLQFAIIWSLQTPTDLYGSIRDGIRGILRGDGRWLADYMIRWRLGVHRSNQAGKLMGYLMECNLTPRRAPGVSIAPDPLFGGEQLEGVFPEICDTLDSLLQRDPPPAASRVPTLFWVGDLDSTTPMANTLALVHQIPGSGLVVLRNAGHTGGTASQKAALLDRITDFFGTGKVRSEAEIL